MTALLIVSRIEGPQPHRASHRSGRALYAYANSGGTAQFSKLAPQNQISNWKGKPAESDREHLKEDPSQHEMHSIAHKANVYNVHP